MDERIYTARVALDKAAYDAEKKLMDQRREASYITLEDYLKEMRRLQDVFRANADAVAATEEVKHAVYAKYEDGILKDLSSGAFLRETAGREKIDEGEGDRFAHAQSLYLERAMQDENGIYRYKRGEDGSPIHRTGEEIQADIDAMPVSPISTGQKLARMMAANHLLTDDQMEEVAGDMRRWTPGTLDVPREYGANEVILYEGDGYLYRCNEPGHTNHGELGWEPPNVPAIWTRIGKPGEEYQAWEMPGGHNAPNKGDLRTHKGAIWESLINGNATEPGSDDRWWKWIKDL